MNEHTLSIDIILENCLTAVFDQGQTVPDSLGQYPEQQTVLEPLLHLSLRLRKAQVVQPDPEFRRIAAVRMQNMIAARPRRLPTSAPRPEETYTIWQRVGAIFAPRRPLAAARLLAILLILSLVLGSATVFAAGDALPGQNLYPVKQFVETVRLNLTTDPFWQAQLHLELANKRLQESVDLVERNRQADLHLSLAAYKMEIETAARYLHPTSQLTFPEKTAFATLLAEQLIDHETQLRSWQTELAAVQEQVTSALETSQDAYSLAVGLLESLLEQAPTAPEIVPTPAPNVTPEPPKPTAVWELPPFWPEDCPSPLEWPEEWPEGCTLLEEWPPEWPEPPGGWPIPPLTTDSTLPPPGWTPPPYWPPECPVPQKWPFSWPEGCVLPTSYPPDWTEPPGGWPDLPTPIPTPDLSAPPEWPVECPLPPDWPEDWEAWPTDCEIPADFEWPAEWPAPPEGWPGDGWVDSPDQLPPPPTGYPEPPDEFPPPGEWPTPPPDDDDEPPPWPWP